MPGYIGTPTGRALVRSVTVGTDAGNAEVEKAWVGDRAGVPRLWYTRFGVTTVLSAVAVSGTRIDLSWTATEGCTYRLVRTGGHTTGPLPNEAAKLWYYDTGLTPNTTYTYRLDIYRGTDIVGTSEASAKTDAVTLDARYAERFATRTASYDRSGLRHQNAGLYFGQYDSSRGLQRSFWMFDIPADVRNCYSIDRIDLRVRSQHTYNGTGATVHMVAFHEDFSSGFPSSVPGSTQALAFGSSTWRVSAPKPGWMNAGNNDASGWMRNCENLVAPGRTTLREEFRKNGARGLGLVPSTSDRSGYGYADGATASPERPGIRIWYTVKL